MGKTRGVAEKNRLTTTTKKLKYAPKWFYLISSQHVKKPHAVSTRILVEDEQGLRYAKAAVSSETLKTLRTILPMGVSIHMPVYLYIVKAVNLKMYSVYACYNPKTIYPLFCMTNIDEIGPLFKAKRRNK